MSLRKKNKTDTKEGTMHKVPRESERPSERLAASLRDAPPELDDFVRARVERNIVDAWRARGARAVELPRKPSGMRGVPAWAVQASSVATASPARASRSARGWSPRW